MASDYDRVFAAASSEKITLGLGALGFAFGPGTVAAIIKTEASFSASRLIFSAGAAAAASYSIALGATGIFALTCSGSSAADTAALGASKWYLVASTKATGTVAPRLHAYDYATKIWTHNNSATSIANSTVPITRSALGVNAVGTGGFWNSDIYAAAVWNIVLTDLQVEALVVDVTLGSWSVAAVPKGMWQLNQASVGTTIFDMTRGGADQSAITGTTVGSFPFAPDPVRPVDAPFVYMRQSN